MATPTRAEIETQWANAVNILEESRLFAESNTPNLVTMIDTLEQSVESDYIDELASAIRSIRNSAASMITPPVAAALQRPFLKQYCKSVIGRGDVNDDQDMLDELYKYMDDNNLYVQSRVFSFGTPTAVAGNVGNGTILRLTTSPYNYEVESQHVDAKRALCIEDHVTGTDKGREVWQITGQTRSRDDLDRSGSGQEVLLTGLSADDSLMQNPSFTQFGGTAASPTSITGWTSNLTVSSTNYAFDSTNYFRAAPSDGSTSYSLQIKNTALLTQKFSLRGTKLRHDRPYCVFIVWNAEVNTANGTLTGHLGRTSNSVVVDGVAGWNVLQVPVSFGQANWYRIFGEDDIDLALEWTEDSASNILIDDVIVAEGTFFDGSYYWAAPATATSYTAHKRLDSFTWADSATDAKIQKWIWRAWGRYLPHNPGSAVTWTEP